MPRYYLHTRDGAQTAVDEDGLDLPDLEAARRVAVGVGADLVAEAMKRGSRDVRIVIYIDGEQGNRLLRLPITAGVHG